MPSGNHTSTRKPLPKATGNRRKHKKRRRGPFIRFRLGRLVFIWIGSLIVFFALYMYNRNVHPEKDVFIQKDSTVDESSAELPAIDSTADESPSVDVSQPDANPTESSQTVIPTKINPVPESASQSSDYLNTIAFLGEKNVYLLGQYGLLGSMNVYAGETLTLDNYTTEYIYLKDPALSEPTSMRIVSAMNSASCPIYLMFGTESLASHPADEVADKFSVLLNALKATAPEAELYILSIPPVTAAAEKGSAPLLNSTIDEYNSLLLALANEANVYFIDTNTALKNNDSKLDAQFADEDGIHLTAEAGQMLLNYILNHIPAD